MQTEFSEDIAPLSDLKANPGKIVNHVKDTHRPVLLTSRGRGVAVAQNLEDYEKDQEECAFMKAGLRLHAADQPDCCVTHSPHLRG